jgi:hypothetical protein
LYAVVADWFDKHSKRGNKSEAFPEDFFEEEEKKYEAKVKEEKRKDKLEILNLNPWKPDSRFLKPKPFKQSLKPTEELKYSFNTDSDDSDSDTDSDEKKSPSFGRWSLSKRAPKPVPKPVPKPIKPVPKPVPKNPTMMDRDELKEFLKGKSVNQIVALGGRDNVIRPIATKLGVNHRRNIDGDIRITARGVAENIYDRVNK